MDNRKLTFGDALYELRASRGWSQNDLAIECGWGAEGGRIGNYELGNKKPQLASILKIVEALEATHEEFMFLIRATGSSHVMHPTPRQIKTALSEFLPRLANHDYAGYIVDDRYTFWVLNWATLRAYGLHGGQGDIQEMMRHTPSAFDVAFNSDINQFMNDDILKGLVRLFKTINLYRQHEPFYRAYPSYMEYLPNRERRLSEKDYGRFLRIWNEIEPRHYEVFTSPVGKPDPERIWKTKLYGEDVEIEFTSQRIFGLSHFFILTEHRPFANIELVNRVYRDLETNAEAIPNGKQCLTLWDALGDEYEAWVDDYFRQ